MPLRIVVAVDEMERRLLGLSLGYRNRYRALSWPWSAVEC